MTNDKRYSISEVVDLTGATEFLLRAWELRYKVVKPKRTKSGRRLYSADDVMKISKIVHLAHQGHKISHLAHLNLAHLSMLEADSNHEKSPRKLSDKKTNLIQKVYENLSKTNWVALKSIFENQRQKVSAFRYIHDFILPVAQEMSYRSMNNSLDIIQEHLLTSLIKENLYALNETPPARGKKFKMIFATTEGDHHDLGLLISKVLAELNGHHCIYLGSHVPKKELSEACMRLQPTHVVIGTSISANSVVEENILKYLHFIDRHIPQKVNLWVGGAGTQKIALQLDRPFHIFKNMDEYSQQIQNHKDSTDTL